MKEMLANYLLSKQWFISIVKQRFLDSIDDVEYHSHAMGCGLEDRFIEDRYEAMSYGWNEGMDAAYEAIDNAA